jgi:Tfp pilus assembly protein PilF
MKHLRHSVLAALVLLGGCATFPPPEAPPPEPSARENSAVVALMQNAREEVGAGRLAAAAANIERALRIEPRNATLWHELARINLHQGQPARAAQFAAKSNALAGEDLALRAANWRLIGQARTQEGDHAGAEAAFAEAAALDRRR